MASATLHSVMHGVVLCGMVWGCGGTCLGAAEREWRPTPLATLPIHPATRYYSLFTLVMLVLFESTVVTSRLRNLDEMRELATPPSAALALRDGKWTPLSSEELLPGETRHSEGPCVPRWCRLEVRLTCLAAAVPLRRRHHRACARRAERAGVHVQRRRRGGRDGVPG